MEPYEYLRIGSVPIYFWFIFHPLNKKSKSNNHRGIIVRGIEYFFSYGFAINVNLFLSYTMRFIYGIEFTKNILTTDFLVMVIAHHPNDATQILNNISK